MDTYVFVKAHLIISTQGLIGTTGTLFFIHKFIWVSSRGIYTIWTQNMAPVFVNIQHVVQIKLNLFGIGVRVIHGLHCELIYFLYQIYIFSGVRAWKTDSNAREEEMSIGEVICCYEVNNVD